VTPATDVYSLGVVLYELLTAEVPFPGDNFVAVAMKHLNEQPPDILQIRPDVPLRLASALDRALEKDPARRFASMGEFAAELRHSLQELGSFDTEHTFVAPSPVLRESAPHRVRARRPRWPLYLLLGLIGAAAIAAGALTLGGSKGKHRSRRCGMGPALPSRSRPVSGYDPQGTGGEHDSYAARATDGTRRRSGTRSITTRPTSGGLKHGVGLVVDAGRAAKGRPDHRDESHGPDSPHGSRWQLAVGPIHAGVGARRRSTRSTTFALSGAAARYYVVWITNLGAASSVDVNEVTARS